MRPQHRLTALPLLGTLLLLLFSGCDKSNGKVYVTYEPIYAPRTSVLGAINGDASESIHNVGKIYVKDPYIFISDTGRGIHVIDNRNPSHPIQTAFLALPGNNDIVIKDNLLYADLSDELLTLDISDIKHVKVKNELPGVFNYFGYEYKDAVIIGWKKVYTKIPPMGGCPNCATDFFSAAPAASASKGTGTGGSMARMTLVGNKLYTVPERHSLRVIDVTNAASPKLGANIYAGFDLETIFPFKDKLFLGSQEGVYIYDLTDPDNPKSVGTFTHGRACDPVIADGNYAYVTLHEGSFCGGASNELDIIDIKNLANPVLTTTVPMTKPMGLSKDGDMLFVCDGPGVKVYNVQTPASPQLTATLDAGSAYDVITTNKRLVVMSDKGLSQFDYSKPSMPLLSNLPLSSIGK